MKTISIDRIEKANEFESIVRTEEVNVCGANVLAVTTADDKCYFSPHHVCQALGINWATQFRKIDADPVLARGFVFMTIPSRGGDQNTMMLPIEFLSGWLFTIKKVAPEVQAKLNLFRAEGFLALDAWFRQGLRSDPVVTEAHGKYAVPQTMAEALEFAAQQVREKNALAELNATLTPKATLFDLYMDTEGTLTLTEAAKILRISRHMLGSLLRYKHRWLFKQKKGVIPTQYAMKQGWMIAVPILGNAVSGKPNCYGRFTKRGLEVLMEKFMIEAA